MRKAKFQGHYRVTCLRVDGSVKWIEEGHNDITDFGLNEILGIMFVQGTQFNNWFMGLIDAAGFSAVADADLMNSHAGWVESIKYTEANRPTIPFGAVVAQKTETTPSVSFTINEFHTLKGVFIVSNSTKSGTTGTLWATALFSGDKAVDLNETLKVDYEITATKA